VSSWKPGFHNRSSLRGLLNKQFHFALDNPCGRGSPAWAEERSHRHVCIVSAWANCRHAWGASCIGKSEAAAHLKTFPTNQNEPFNFLNLDLYVKDTWKVTPKLTWTVGIRDTFNSNPLNPHAQVARLRGSFDPISHDVNQPLNAAIQTHLGNLFSFTPLAILQSRTAIAWQFEPKTVLRTGFGLFSDILPGTVADLVGMNPPYVRTCQGGLLGRVGGAAIAPGVPNSAVDATVAADQRFSSSFANGQLSCASPLANAATCLPPVAISAVPNGTLHAPYFMEWSLGIEHQVRNDRQHASSIRRHPCR